MMMVLQVVVAQAGVINGLQDGYHGGLVVGGGGQAGGEDDGPGRGSHPPGRRVLSRPRHST